MLAKNNNQKRRKSQRRKKSQRKRSLRKTRWKIWEGSSTDCLAS